jgi:signal transduction histidine kinase
MPAIPFIKLLRTRVAQRIFALFVLCALLPVAALAAVSFFLVEDQLNDQSHMRLQQETKALALALSEQLSLLEAGMRLVASNFNSFLIAPKVILHRELLEDVRERFTGLAVLTENDYSIISGRVEDPPPLTLDEKRHLGRGRVLLAVEASGRPSKRVLLYTYLDADREEMGTLIGEVRMENLEKVAEARSPETELTVLDARNRILFGTVFNESEVPPSFLQEARIQKSGLFPWTHDGRPHVVSRLSLPLRSSFHYPEWTVVLTASEEALLAPMGRFKRSFPVVIVLSLGLVFVLSLILIRRSLTPMETLKEATRRIAGGEIGHQIVVRSGDEFEELGSAFNHMSGKLRETQEMLVRGQRLSTMGEMAAGMVHEIKQPLTAIHGLLEFSIVTDQLSDDAKERLNVALEGVKRLDGMLNKFGSFSRISKEKMEPLAVDEVMERVRVLLAHQMEMQRIECVADYPPSLPLIEGDRQALEQVFSNLLMNAIHALEEREGSRRIELRAHASDVHVLVEVRDNGTGIPPEIRDKIFSPFFTTKGADRGTGLGMAIVESILHKHQAGIELDSRVGEGTTFRIRFAAATSPESDRTTPPAPAGTGGGSPSPGSGTEVPEPLGTVPRR